VPAPEPPREREATRTGDDLLPPVVGLARTLRAAGVDATSDRVHAFVAALDRLDAARRRDVYWAGRLTLCSDPDDLERYDRVFAAFFDHDDAAGSTGRIRRSPARTAAVRPTAGADAADADETRELTVARRQASARELLRHRDVATLDPGERAQLARLLAAFSLPGPSRRTRRREPASGGAVHRRRTVRRMLQAGGEAGELRFETPRDRPRRVVLLVDVSGSMEAYADALLRFAHAAVRRYEGRTEVFTMGTRLTRVTVEMSHRDPDTAMRAVAGAVPDWSGGTRLAETLRTFLAIWGRPGVARGAVVVVLSDGWETGDAADLGEQAEQLHRLAHRVVWANPRAGRPGFEPTAAGMAAALPHCDELVEGHSLAALEHLAAVVLGEGRHAAHATGSHRTVVPGGRAEPVDA
jgi:uncharacterized protein